MCDLNDSAFKATSQLDDNRKPQHSKIGRPLGWTPKTNPSKEFVEVKFDDAKQVKYVMTQGCEGGSSLEYVTSYTLKYLPIKNSRWQDFTDESGQPKVFDGNCDNETIKPNVLDEAVRTYGIRLYPRGFVGCIALRWGVFEDNNGAPCTNLWRNLVSKIFFAVHLV